MSKAASTALKTLLATSRNLYVADLYTITLLSGTVVYMTDAPVDIVFGGNTYTAAINDNEPGIGRGPIKLAIGLQVESIEVHMLYDSTTLFQGVSPGAFAIAGGFDGARIKIDKLLTDDYANTSRGVVNLFNGTVSEVQADADRVTMNVSSDLIYLNAAFPRNYLLPQCNNALFDAACGLNKAAYAVAGTCTAGNTKTNVAASAITTGNYALGYIIINTGVNANLVRSIKLFASGNFTLLYPLPQPCANGDTFTVYPGCDKTETMCDSYGNRAHFRGFPFVPTPEQVEMGSTTGNSPADGGGGGGFVSTVAHGIVGGSGGQNTQFKQQ